jgi:hypothetical protein
VPEEELLGATPLTTRSMGVATDDATGEAYIADGADARVERLGSEGAFLGAWGWNVIRTGPGKAGTSREEVIRIKRTSGGEDVVYKGQGSETNPLSYEAKPEVVEEELDKLTIESETEGLIKGEIKVFKESPGVYRFTYGGALGDELSGAIGVEKDGLEGEVKEEVIIQGSPAFEDCAVTSGDICRKPKSFGRQGENPGEFWSPRSVAVDQENGDVYVLDQEEHLTNAVQVFKADGERTGIEFGESTSEKLGKVGEAEKSPAKLRVATSIAVDSMGDSYIVNAGISHKEESRISVFDPGGTFLESLARKCGVGFEKGCGLAQVAVDSAGNIYTIGQEERAYEFQRSAPNEPVCESPIIGGLEALTVTESGESIVYSGKSSKFYWLNSCKGKVLTDNTVQDFENKSEPPEVHTTAIAFNGVSRFPFKSGYIRKPGVVYAANPSVSGFKSELNTGLIFAPSEEKEGHTITPPRVTGESVSSVGLSYVSLNAQIEPYSDPIRYSFRYWTDSQVGEPECSQVHECEAPVGGAELKTGGDSISVTISGLVPGAIYHFDLLGYSACDLKETKQECIDEGGVELEGGVEQEFSTFTEDLTNLPDGRRYELVSPPLKDGGEVFSLSPDSIGCTECLPGGGDEKFPMVSTSDGGAMVYEGYPFSATGDAVDENQYLATRSSEGWMTRDLSPDAAVRNAPIAGYKAFSPDLSSGVFVQTGASLSPEAPVNYPNVYLQDTSAPGTPVRPLWTGEDFESDPPHRGPEGTGPEELQFVVGGMAEGHVIFAANDALTSATETAPTAADGGESAYNLYEWLEGKLRLVNVLPGNGSTQPGAVFGSGTEFATSAGDPDYAHAISTDGSRIFWTDSENHRVYVRMDGKETVEIPGAAGFLTASVDGSKVLLNDGHIYDLETEMTADLTSGKGGFEGILGTSEELSKVYFTDTKVLPGTTPNAYGSSAVEGGNNLYLWQEGSSTTRYITTLGGEDNNDGAAMNITATETGDWAASPSDRTSQVTSNGRYVAFMSEVDLTGYDSLPASGTCGLGRTACDEIFEYDAEADRLVCVSCNPTKERPLGGSTLSLIKPGSGFMAQPSNLLDDGRVFFDSVDALSPEAQHAGSAENVYEYQPDGFRTCGRVSGCVFTISSGSEETNSSFVNATPSGSDVFFTTRSQLVSQDQDDLVDLYDAREGGGFAPKAPPAACAESERCQGLPSPLSSTIETPLTAKLSNVSSVGNVIVTEPKKARPLTRAQLLAKALHVCHNRFKAHHAKRIACEKSAHRRYGSPVSAKRSNSKSKGGK